MALFQNKQNNSDAKKLATNEDMRVAEEHFFDEYFREELRNRGRWYFERVINENGQLFKEDLDETVAGINQSLKQHITSRLEEAILQINADLKEHTVKELENRMTEYTQSMKSAQDNALAVITENAKSLALQHSELRTTLQQNVTEQQDLLHRSFEENKAQMIAMKDAQDAALQWLNQSAQAMHEKYQKLDETLERNIAVQEEISMRSFEENMAQVIEHYLLGALGDQFDLKAQLPSIIKQMEANKQAIMDDISL